MTGRQDELEDFKTRIDLVAFAEQRGYVVDTRASSRSSVAVAHPGTGDKLLIGRGADRHLVYCSVRDAADNGSIIDFIQKRDGLNLGQVRKLLRPWIDGSPSNPPTASGGRLHTSGKTSAWPLEPVKVDLAGVRDRFSRFSPISGPHRYLNEARAIPAAVYDHPRFTGRLRQDERGNVCMPHWNAKGEVCGYELKNAGFTGFAPGGMKGLFGSRTTPADMRLVICETGLDLLLARRPLRPR